MTAGAQPATGDRLDDVVAGRAPAFALLYRPVSGSSEHVDVLTGTAFASDTIARIPLPAASPPPGGARDDVLVVLPYRQITERGFACRDDGEPITGLEVTGADRVPLADALRRLPQVPLSLVDGDFDIDDERYAATVRRVISDEIGRGMGSNFVIKRTFSAGIPGYSPRAALTFFRRLVASELNTYWTFLVHTGDRTFVGATPERHVTLSAGRVTMQPISGTYRYPPQGPRLQDLMEFLADGKEADELYMVVDEELKMMGRVCQDGGRVDGPYLREMAKLAHTEYVLDGTSARGVREILRETMFAPTVTGSPIENACRVIARHEPVGRGYYSGVMALIGRDAAGDRVLDSSILIRTAEIDRSGVVRIGVGATLVRHSDPYSEVAETRAKAAALQAALAGTGDTSPAGRAPQAQPPGFADHADVRAALAERNAHLARYWFDRQDTRGPVHAELFGRRGLVIDAEDTFTSMLGHQLRSLGLDVTIRVYHEIDEQEPLDGLDFVLVGPGPGDPCDIADPKIDKLRRIVTRLLDERVPFLAVCLGHQVLATLLGQEIVRKDVPSQGVQREIELFGRRQRAGFYNTFAARCPADRIERPALDGPVLVCRDPATGEVHALRGPTFSSMQFHLESVLTEHGVDILCTEVARLLAPATAAREEVAAVSPAASVTTAPKIA